MNRSWLSPADHGVMKIIFLCDQHDYAVLVNVDRVIKARGRPAVGRPRASALFLE